MNDRLGALSRFTPVQPPKGADQEESEESSSDPEQNSRTGTEETSAEDDNLDPIEDIHAEADQLTAFCNQIEENLNLIQTIFRRNLTDGTAAAQSGGKDPRLDALRRDTNSLSNNVRGRLKALKAANDASSKADANSRMRQNIQTTLTKRFVQLMQRYQQIQTQYRQDHREHIHREAEVIRPGITREEVDTLIDHGDMAQLMQTSLVQGDRQKDKATLALVHIKEQHRDIIELEQSIAELYQIFVDMANLVDAQGEMIDQISYNVDQAAAWTGEAIKELKKARQYKTKERKKCCALCMSCGALMAAAAGGIALGLAPLAACSIQ